MPHGQPIQIDGHTFDPRLLRAGDWALDAGCRGFALARFLAARGVRVLALDADPDVQDPRIHGVTFVNAAIVAEKDAPAGGSTLLYRYHTSPEAHTTRWGPPESAVRVAAVTLRSLMRRYGAQRFALVKLDIEGDEYGIIEELASSPAPRAEQISVEYHDFCGRNPNPDEPGRWHAENTHRLSRLYHIRKQEPEPLPWDPGHLTYMDCWYLAKDACPRERRPQHRAFVGPAAAAAARPHRTACTARPRTARTD